MRKIKKILVIFVLKRTCCGVGSIGGLDNAIRIEKLRCKIFKTLGKKSLKKAYRKTKIRECGRLSKKIIEINFVRALQKMHIMNIRVFFFKKIDGINRYQQELQGEEILFLIL